jgi:hypothetical protein
MIRGFHDEFLFLRFSRRVGGVVPAAFLAISLATGMAGCASVSTITTGGLSMHGEKVEAGRDEVLYYRISIDFQRGVSPAVLAARVQLAPEFPPVALQDLSPELVSEHLGKYVAPPQLPEIHRGESDTWLAFQGDGLFIRFHEDGRPMIVGLCSHCMNSRQFPVIAAPDGQRFHLPLTRYQAEEVFGPLPRAKGFSQVYY